MNYTLFPFNFAYAKTKLSDSKKMNYHKVNIN